MPLYHYQIGFPKQMEEIRPVFGLIPSHHAKVAAVSDPRGLIKLPLNFIPRTAQVIEVETDMSGRKILKILARQPMDNRNDVVYAFLPDSKLIKTAWLQTHNDLHKTLDRSKYDAPGR